MPSIYSNKNAHLHPKQQKPIEDFLKSLTYDSVAGHFYWRSDAPSKRGRNKLAGSLSKSDGYRYISLDNYNYSAHRLVWFFETGAWPTGIIDHINGVKDDNRFCNLRDVSHPENHQNVEGKSRGKHGLGVAYYPYAFRGDKRYLLKRPYTAKIRIVVDGKRKAKFLGSYATKEEAQQAYLNAKRELHTHIDRFIPKD